jgi:hypothetical protein
MTQSNEDRGEFWELVTDMQRFLVQRRPQPNPDDVFDACLSLFCGVAVKRLFKNTKDRDQAQRLCDWIEQAVADFVKAETQKPPA